MPDTSDIVVTIAALPPGWSGTPQQLLDFIQANFKGSVAPGFLTGNVGSVEPAPNSGPWFKNGGIDGIFVWDPVAADYVPISQNADVGKFDIFAYNAIDLSKWVVCDGSAIPRSSPYDVLFSKIGTTHGTGDGATTFNVPDFKGRVIVGAGTGTGLSARALGQKFGEETHKLTAAESAALTLGPEQHGSAGVFTYAAGYGADGNGHNNVQPSGVGVIAIRYA